MNINDLSARDKAKEVTNILLQFQPEVLSTPQFSDPAKLSLLNNANLPEQVQRPLWSEEDLEQWFEDPHPKPREEIFSAEERPPLSPVKLPGPLQMAGQCVSGIALAEIKPCLFGSFPT